MKPIKFLHTVLAFVLLFTMLTSKTAYAQQNIDNLSPNIYEEKERDNDTDFFNEEPLNEQKTPIPEEQKSLTFKMKPDEKWENVKNNLFAEGEREKNSVAAKAKQLQLFTGKTPSRFLTNDEQTNDTGRSALAVVYMIVIALGVLGILLLVLTGMKKRKEEFH
ncbi:type VII secretion protein EssA [Fictibacillus iocasae]|uniref:Type VII secretion protein EssA n=1 Tax=Fictibacillus iocasae TaxID=2715437 RepID=A0ABW2NW68_9BACL